MAAPNSPRSELEALLDSVCTKFLDEVPGLTGVIISSTDNVCFHKHFKQEEEHPRIATIFPFVVEQVGKHRWGSIRSVKASFQNAAIVHLSINSLIFTFVGEKGLDVETLTSEDTYERLRLSFDPLSNAIRAEQE